MQERVFNFSAGPAIIPEPVLKKAQEDLFALPGVGMSVMEISHRSKTFDDIHKNAKAGIKKLLDVSDDYEILFLQGGASLQFSMIPMNFMTQAGKADYIVTGSWSKKAVKEAKRVGTVNIAATDEENNFKKIPTQADMRLDAGADYVHFTSNNTIFGTQFKEEPVTGDVPLMCDASSDILHKKIDVSKYGILYAGAQKNMGPSGIVLSIVRKDLLERSSDDLPSMLNYKLMAEKDSLYNTPNCWGIYIIGLVAEYLLDFGGLDAMYKQNKEKAELLYNAIDESGGYYNGHAEKESRSLMNVTFRLGSEELEKKFIAEATEQGLNGLKGHRSVGGLRASIYNAFPPAGVEKLVEFMKAFKEKN